MITEYNRLSGLQKVAILFSILGESLALNLVNDLDQTEIRKIRAAMRGVGNVSFAVKKQVMEEFYFSFVSEKFQPQEEDNEPKKSNNENTEKNVDEEVDDYQLTRAFDLILALNLVNTRTE